MKVEYKGKKWDKEVLKCKKMLKDTKGVFNKNELHNINKFLTEQSKDYLRLYSRLSGDYERMATYYYLNDIDSKEIIKYTYLSGISLFVTKYLYEKGIRTFYNEIIEDDIDNIDYALFQMIAVDNADNSYVLREENNLIMLMYHQKYEQAKLLLEKLSDNPDEAYEIYYLNPENLKTIYMAIIEHDEKRFNEELVKRIKKYRKNMVGYSTIIDIASVALIKMAEREGLCCMVDVIEIPKQFFDKSCVIDKSEIKLPYYDEFISEYELL